MRVLQIIQKKQLRGAEIFACQLSIELIKLGHHVDMLYLFENQNSNLIYDLNFISLNADRRKRFWDFSAYKRLARIIESGGYDIVQANAADTLKYAAFSKKLFRWKTTLIFRNANKMSDFIRSKVHKALNVFFLKEADFIISVSENCRQDIVKLYPSAKNISTTATIGTFDFSSIKESEVNGERPVWINVGSFVPEKNHEFLISVFAEFVGRFNKGELWLVGDGKLREGLENQVEDLGLSSKVRFFGYRDDVIRLIKSAEIMVMPSKIEGLPGVILEALSCGKPVVAAAVGGIPEIVIDDLTGYSIDGYDSKLYIERIRKVLSSKQVYSKLSTNGKKMVKEKFLMSEIGKHFESIYERIL